jgi:predicted HTH transcriptional regulator
MILLIIIVILAFTVFKLKKEVRGQNLDYQDILSNGETDTVEFKSSLRYDLRQQATNKKLELVIAKTVSAFLNTNGGMLIIGVDDNGKVLGLENDYLTLNKKNRDGFVLALTNVININIGKKTHNFITITIEELDGNEIAIITVEKSDSPVFFGKANAEEFYIRAAASSQPLGLKETHEYIQSHWKNS